MKLLQHTAFLSFIALSIGLSGCDDRAKQPASDAKVASEPVQATPKKELAEVLPYLNIQEQTAQIALPFCETKNCIELEIQTLKTKDSWLNTWIEQKQAQVIQDQIGLKQQMSLQQAVNAYVKKSDAWQAEFKANHAYELAVYTRIPYQRNQFVLMQVGVDSAQENIKVKERYYFFVADRRTQKNLTALDIIEPKQQAKMDAFVQKAYAQWLKEQNTLVRKDAPKKLYWGQADWFFDQEGIGLHYRSNEIVKDGQQLDIYLTKEQTQQVLKADIYPSMF
ncbi:MULTISPECIES: hypothetical protein [Acinetobacter]|uniref:hypothetical protein n=1 Tax=Acinetobacter TaxID=469 RepID=UPI000EA0BAB8|nr:MULTISPECIES: hypothetical protein [Acinetobacter]RKG44515.1 hypothetical protein D7V51_07080 [Acinetobacter cumulans]RZG59872.1 hypothetical protein EXE29_06910 [Acinetobacter sp. WCHAc060006]